MTKPVNLTRRRLFQAGITAGGLGLLPSRGLRAATDADKNVPILVAVELSGGNDGLNTVVPYTDDTYYRLRPRIGIKASKLLRLDDEYGLNPGMLGLHRLWQENQLAIVHGCGYEQPSYSHFTSMAYWHTGVPHRGSQYGWMGRLADAMADERRDNMLINIAPSQSLAVNSQIHTPVVFQDPARFQRHHWMASETNGPGGTRQAASEVTSAGTSSNPARDYLRAVSASAEVSSRQVRDAWSSYKTDIDYGIVPMDLPKVAACIDAGFPTQLYYVSFSNNAFDTHVNQPALHRRLLSYACDGIHGFIKDLERINQAHRVIVMVFSEFGRRVPENANLGTDHGTANVMFVAGSRVNGGHYGKAPSLTRLVDGDNLSHTTDFRRVYASAIEGWLGVNASDVLGAKFKSFPMFT